MAPGGGCPGCRPRALPDGNAGDKFRSMNNLDANVPPGPILGVWAHPDDETYLSAGLMAAAVKRGDRVVCVTATRGEKGSWDEDRWPTSRLGAIRESELMASMEVLGVTEHHWLDYEDGGCGDIDFEEGVARVQAIMNETRPRTVLTFGPDGMTGHLDHKAVSAWTTEALLRVAQEGARLFYATVTPEWAERFAPRFEPFHVFMEPGTPPITPLDEMGLHFPLPPDLQELKLEAISKHVSQVEGMLNAFGADFFKEAHAVEYYRPVDLSEQAGRVPRPLAGWRPDPEAG
jgi:LmbE family N-acetylglucosaminyl deacetylase